MCAWAPSARATLLTSWYHVGRQGGARRLASAPVAAGRPRTAGNDDALLPRFPACTRGLCRAQLAASGLPHSDSFSQQATNSCSRQQHSRAAAAASGSGAGHGGGCPRLRTRLPQQSSRRSLLQSLIDRCRDCCSAPQTITEPCQRLYRLVVSCEKTHEACDITVSFTYSTGTATAPARCDCAGYVGRASPLCRSR